MGAVVLLGKDESVNIRDVSAKQGALEERLGQGDVQAAALFPDVTL